MLEIYEARRKAVWKSVLRSRKVDALFVSNPVDVSYLTGFSGFEQRSAYLVYSAKWEVLIPGRFYRELAAKECGEMERFEKEPETYSAVSRVLKGRGVRRLGIQADYTTVTDRRKMEETFGGKKLVDLENLAISSRIRKDDGELKNIRKAVKIARTAFEKLIGRGAKGLVGRTEREIAAELEHTMKSLGAEEKSFDTIVGSGPHSSRCHHIPGTRKVREGEPLLIDWGAKVGGYRSDLTRTLFMGRITPQFSRIYTAVHAAVRAGIAAVKSGVRCSTVDRAARNVIKKADFGDHFIHGLGHGLGRDVHEAPIMSSASKERLRTDMVITIEPGIYFPGTGGVRIEEDVLVTDTGARKFSGPSTKQEDMILKG